MKERNSDSMDWGLLILRLALAALLVWNHGWDKFTGAIGYLFGGNEWGFTSFIASIGIPLPEFFAVCAALAESVGCLMVAAGLFTRYAAALVATTMSVAVYYHVSTATQIELAAIYFLMALFFVFAGAGRFSVDELLRNRLKPAPMTDTARTTA